MNPLAAEIESYLLEEGRGWVTSVELCARFGVKERALRCVDAQPGLCSQFAISGDRGFKHVERATTGEWLRFKARMVWHAVGELRRVRALGRRRALVRARRGPGPVERDTGQRLLELPVEGRHGVS